MPQYIDVDKLIEDMKENEPVIWTDSPEEIAMKNQYEWDLDTIKDAKIVDVAPVVHGMWSHLGGDEWCCTNCGYVISTEGSWEEPIAKYCEECGTRMDGGEPHD